MARYIFVCSAGHSGSTLLDMLLGSHPQVRSLGEIAQLPKNFALQLPCTCGVSVPSCPFWQEVLRSAEARLGLNIWSNPYSLSTGYPRSQIIVDEHHQTRAYLIQRKIVLGLAYLELRLQARLFLPLTARFHEGIRNTFCIYDIVREVSGVDSVVDSSKSYLKALWSYRERPSEVKIIILTRDGRGVMHSHMKRHKSRESSVRHWKNYYARSLPLFSKYVAKENIQYVKYENLASDPAKEIKRICKDLNLRFHQEMLDFALHDHHNINGNNMRFGETSRISVDTTWQENLSDEDLRYFKREAGALNNHLGYH